jgi:hypothetical protein
MCRETRLAVLLGIVALEQDQLVLFEPWKVEPAMIRIVSKRITLTDLVGVNEIDRHEVLGIDGARIAQRERGRLDRTANRAPDVDLPETTAEPVLGFLRRKMVPDAARSDFAE